jgi:ribosomal protein L2
LKISESEIAKLKIVKPLARRWKGRISTVYEMIRGVKARLVNHDFLPGKGRKNKDILVSSVKQEYEGNHSMCGASRSMYLE